MFPSHLKNSDSHVKDLGLSYKVISSKAGLYITAHDLRRTFASVANSLSMSYPVLKRLLNHRDSKISDDVTLQYIQISQREIRAALNEIEKTYFSQADLTQDAVIVQYFTYPNPPYTRFCRRTMLFQKQLFFSLPAARQTC